MRFLAIGKIHTHPRLLLSLLGVSPIITRAAWLPAVDRRRVALGAACGALLPPAAARSEAAPTTTTTFTAMDAFQLKASYMRVTRYEWSVEG